MVKVILKVIWYILVILSFLLCIYFLFEGQGAGIENLKDLFSNGFLEGLKEFFIQIWNGLKFVCGIN
jgi:Trk-type K+ transport system membrane component